MADPVPVRRGKYVALLPGNGGVADPAATLPLGHHAYRVAGAAVTARWQIGLAGHQVTVQCGQHGTLAVAVHITQQAAPVLAGLCIQQCAPGATARVPETAGTLATHIERIGRQSNRPFAQRGSARRRRFHQVPVRAGQLQEHRVEVPAQRQVEPVEPDHAPTAGVHMFVPGPGRRQHQVTLGHGTTLIVDAG